MKLLSKELEDDNCQHFNLLNNDCLENAISNWSTFSKIGEILRNQEYNELQRAKNMGMLDEIGTISPIRIPFACFKLQLDELNIAIDQLQEYDEILNDSTIKFPQEYEEILNDSTIKFDGLC